MAIGSETNGSLVTPAHACGVVAIKPTVGLTSRHGCVPISHTQDSIGSLGTTVADAAALLEAMVGRDTRDPTSLETPDDCNTGFTAALKNASLKGKRIGVARML